MLIRNWLAGAAVVAALSVAAKAAVLVSITQASATENNYFGLPTGWTFVVHVSTDDSSQIASIDVGSTSNGLFGKMFQDWGSYSTLYSTPTGSSTTSSDSHLLTGGTSSITAGAEDNDFSTDNIDTSSDATGYGTYLKGVATYSAPAASVSLAAVTLGNATQLFPASSSTGALFTVTGTATLVGGGIVPFTVSFVPEPASVAMLGITAAFFLRRRRNPSLARARLNGARRSP